MGFNVGLGMKLPYIQADFAAILDTTAGVCATSNPFGVEFSSKIGVDINAQAAFKGREANPIWKRQLYVSDASYMNTTSSNV